MAANAWTLHDDFKFKLGNKEISLASDTFEIRLATSASNVATTSVGDATTVTNEVTGNGYAAQSTAVTWTQFGSSSTFDGADVAFTASGGNIVYRYAYLVDTTLVPDLVVAHTTIDNTPADITIPSGETRYLGLPDIFSLS
jgi:hypothetical protein